jgi:hypothetical protein
MSMSLKYRKKPTHLFKSFNAKVKLRIYACFVDETIVHRSMFLSDGSGNRGRKDLEGSRRKEGRKEGRRRTIGISPVFGSNLCATSLSLSLSLTLFSFSLPLSLSFYLSISSSFSLSLSFCRFLSL